MHTQLLLRMPDNDRQTLGTLHRHRRLPYEAGPLWNWNMEGVVKNSEASLQTRIMFASLFFLKVPSPSSLTPIHSCPEHPESASNKVHI